MENTVKTAKQLRAEKELRELLESSSEICAGLNGTRARRKTKDRNAEYFEAVAAQEFDAGVKGGLVKGSGYHYDRQY
jgi:hypothetical protein